MKDLHVSAYQNLKAPRQVFPVSHRKIHVIHLHVDQILNAPYWVMDSLNAHVNQAILKVQTLFEVVLNREIPVNQIHVARVPLVMSLEILFAIVLNQL